MLGVNAQASDASASTRRRRASARRTAAACVLRLPDSPRSPPGPLRKRLLAGHALALAFCNVPALAQNVITPDGRTQTQVNVSGAVTNITTSTVAGQTGYNSFSRFQVGAGATVNMHLPNGTGSLVNIVRSGPVVVDGVLNSYRNGRIGGNVYFSDSYGFTVGPRGVINTGSLTVNTPTREFLDQVISPNGVVNGAAVARLLANDVPISPDGTITIDGRINARGSVTLHGASVSVTGRVSANAAPVDVAERRQTHRRAFETTVNTRGLARGGAMVARRGGGVEIVAAGSVSISGRVRANATPRRAAGIIAIRAGGNATIAATARITAKGATPARLQGGVPSTGANGDGGKISITTAQAIAVAAGSIVDASAGRNAVGKGGEIIVYAGTNLDAPTGTAWRAAGGATGDGGFIELSAKQTATIGAIALDLSARDGRAGTFLIDPYDLVISGAYGTAGSTSIRSDGANVLLQADNSITVAADGSIDTRQFNRANGVLSASNPSTGNSGSITLEAPIISILGELRADVIGAGRVAGDIKLDSTKSHTRIAGLSQATSTIDVSGVISGRNIELLTNATAITSYTDSAQAIATSVGQSLGAALLGLNGGYVASRVESRVSLNFGAQVTGTGHVTILAGATQEASMPAMTITGISPLAASINLGEIDGVVKAEVLGGATITAGGNLTVKAFNDVTLSVTSLSVSTANTRVNATVAYGSVDVNTSSIVHSGATINAGSASQVYILARNNNSFSTSASAFALAGGQAGIAVAYSDTAATATARLGASLGSAGSSIGGLAVEAISNNDLNKTSSSVMVGDNALINAVGVGSLLNGTFTALAGRLGIAAGERTSVAKVGSAVSYADSRLTARASIAADDGSTAPSIYASGNVSVVGHLRDFAVRVLADSSINSNSNDPAGPNGPSGSNPEATTALSFGVAIGNLTHTTDASIGKGVRVEATRIGVGATTETPIANTWTNWAGLTETISHLNGNFGIVNNILTSYANATTSSAQLGLAGSVNYLRLASDTSAWVGEGATLRQTLQTAAWSKTLDDSFVQNFASAAAVQADTITHSIDVAGNLGIFSIGSINGGSGSAIGGALNDVGHRSTTVAAIASGANVISNILTVAAHTSDKIFAISPTSGAAKGALALNGIASHVNLNNRTLASISKEATITSSTVKIEATQFVSLFALTGAVSRGAASGVGLSVAVLTPTADTRAYIGDNTGDLSDNRLARANAGAGTITTSLISVGATSEGRLISAAMAAAVVDPAQPPLDINSLSMSDSDFEAAAAKAGGPAFSLSAAGVASVATTRIDTTAVIDGVTITDPTGLGQFITQVNAVNSTIIENGAGAAALNLSGNQSASSNALAGAVAVGILNNSTDAAIRNSTLTHAEDVTVRALSGGRQTIVGLGLAGASSNIGAAAAMSVSVGLVTDHVGAEIANSTLTGVASGSHRDVNVNAYQTTDIGIGAGALSLGGRAGFGAALTYASIGDPSGKDAVSAQIRRSGLISFDSLQVTATDSSRIATGAAAGGGGADANGLVGAFVITDITPTVRAGIFADGGSSLSIGLTGEAIVLADGAQNSTFNSIISGSIPATAWQSSQIDFTGAAGNDGVANPAGASITAIAGAVQAGQNSLGLSLLRNRISQSHIAAVDGVDVLSTGGDVTVTAIDGSTITSIAIGAALAAGKFAGLASTSLPSIDNVVSASISGSGTMVTGRDVSVQALAASSIRGVASSLAFSGGVAAAGLSVVQSSVANQVSSDVTGATIVASRDVKLLSNSTARISAFAFGVAMARNVGIAGSIVDNTIDTSVRSQIAGGADVIAENNLGVVSSNVDTIIVVAGALGAIAGSPGVAGGVSVVNNTIGGETVSRIANSTVDARAAGTGALTVDNGRLVNNFDLTSAIDISVAPPDLAMQQREVRGLGVVATSRQAVRANSVTAGLAIFPISGAVALSPIENVMAGRTSATIESSSIDTRLTGTAAPEIAVLAGSHSYAATYIIALAAGGVAGSGADAKTVMSRETTAGLSQVTVGTTTPGYAGPGVGTMDVNALASQAAAGMVIGTAAGLGAGAASGIVDSFDATTAAYVDGGLVRATRLGVVAESANGFNATAGAGAGGAVGLGTAFVIADSSNATYATIGGGPSATTINLKGDLTVSALNTSDFDGLAAGGVGAGAVGVAGMAMVVNAHNDTRATVTGASITQPANATDTTGGVSHPARVSVTAAEIVTVEPTTGAGVLSGALGFGSATIVVNLDGRVLAGITDSAVFSPGAVAVAATSTRTINAETITLSNGGTTGIGAAIGVIKIGSAAPSEALAELNTGGDGTLSRVNQLTAVSGDFVLSSSGLTAYRAALGAAATGQTDEQIRATALADYRRLLQNGTVASSALTLTTSGVAALRSVAAAALGVANPTDAQVRSFANARYQVLDAGRIGYTLSDAGLNSYRSVVAATVTEPSDDLVRSMANDAYQRLVANGTIANGVLTLSAQGVTNYQSDANAALGRTATAAEVKRYAANQYSFFVSYRSRLATPGGFSATAAFDQASSAISATVSGGSVSAGSLAVTSAATTATSNHATGVGVGSVGVGAAVAYTRIGDAISATVQNAVVNAGTVAITSTAQDGANAAARVKSEAGAGAGAAAAGAAVADAIINNAVTATGAGQFTLTGAASISATDATGVKADAFGATAGGGGALGVSLATASRTSLVDATFASGARIVSGTGLTITASGDGFSYASSTAGAGGLLVAGSGADSRASDESTTTARIGSGASVNVGTGAIAVSATSRPDAKARAYGVAVTGGLAVGAAVARANVDPTTTAAIDGGASPQGTFTAGRLSLSATNAIYGTPLGDIGAAPGSTDSFARGGMSAMAWTVAGSGAYYASAVGTDARARNDGSTKASVGDNIVLPASLVSILSSNTTAQAASSTGIAVGGKYAVGVVLSEAGAGTSTTATLGDNVRMTAAGAGSFTLSATGSDTQIARSKAGNGGLLAGSGAEAKTFSTATTQALAGSGVQLNAGTILFSAKHTDAYANAIDSTAAAAVGASASVARHNANSNVLTSIGANAILAALGADTDGCYVSTCAQAISLTARNEFQRLNLGDTISAGAGGGINGVGAVSTTTIDGTSRVLLGDGATLGAGNNPITAPGPILLMASTDLRGVERVALTTGGLLQGAGVTAHYTANVDNEVSVGANSAITSAGVINIGTYTAAGVTAEALVSTYGLAAVGVADADVTIITDQDVTIGSGSTLTALDNLNVAAGRDASGVATTNINATATALGYVRGLIAVPDAEASTDLKNRATLTINSNAALLSAQNVSLGAFNGTLNASTDGAGHGYQLYLIPVTQRDESPSTSSTSTVVMNGRAVGGVFHEQEITIGCGVGGASICGVNDTPTIYIKPGGAPVSVGYDPAFNAVDYVRANYTTYVGQVPDTTVADTLVGGVASGTVKAVRLGQLYAAGGNVFVNGATIQGAGSLTAYGGPTIKVVNNSAAYLIIDGGAHIPDLSTGQILFTGAAQGSSGLSQSRVNADGTASIIINNAYTRDDIGGYGPALLIGGDVTNLGGLVSLNNTMGSFGFSGQRIDALQLNVTVPNGAVAIASNGPNGMYMAGASPMAEWNHAITYPGATPGAPSNTYVINDTVNAIANTLYFGSGSSLNYNLYHRIEDGGNPGLRVSTIMYGNCIGYGSTGMNCVGGYDFGNGINFALIPIVPKYYQSNAVQAQGGGTQIYGAQVAIKATTININASIEAGRVTNQSVRISGDFGLHLAYYIQQYQLYPGSFDPVIDLSTSVHARNIFTGERSTTVVNAGDKLIPVTYDIRTGQLSVSNVNASSGGGSVLLDGQIISTNTLGRIKINGGFGHVNIVNDSGNELVVNRVNTGTAAGANAAVSKITIVDRLRPVLENTTVYAYTPGVGIRKYISSNGAQPILSGANASAPVAIIAGDATSYSPVAGTRYEWTQQLMVYKDGLVSGNPNAQGVWRYSSGSANNPWVYVAGPASGIWGDGNSSGPDWWNQSTTPQGRVTHNPYYYISDPVFFQTLQGGVSQVSNAMQTYENCNGGNPSFCSRDFRQVPGSTANTYWNYNHVFDAWLQVTASVKADNPFAVSFAGNSSGVINITSNSTIRQVANMTNPSGATTITSTAGSFFQTPQATILSNHLTITARGAVGATDAPIKASLTAGAAIAAYSGAAGINLDLDSDAKIWRLNADRDPGVYGDINVRATGGLEVASWAPADYTHALGRNITISSRDGAVGGIARPLRMQAVATTLANGSQADGVVNITAAGDIGVIQLSGDLRVGQIASAAGNVRIDVPGGRLVSATGQTAAQALSAEQLATVSRVLRLTQADGADAAAQASVGSFERQVTHTYKLYSSLIANGTVSGGVFTLNASAIPLYQAFANAALGRTADATEVAAYARERYQSYASVFSMAYGQTWSAQARFNPATLDTNFNFSASAPDAAPGLAASITANSTWQPGQLAAAIDQAALQPGQIVVGNGRPLVVGRDVTLTTGGSIGSLAPDVAVALSNLQNGTLTTEQLKALAVATTAGSVKIIGRDQSNNRVVVADLNAVPAGVTLTGFEIAQTAPLFINATGAFNASAQGDIYVQASTGSQSSVASLNIGRVTATGGVNLQSPQNVTVATQPNGQPFNSVQIQAGGDLILAAQGGGIGSATRPLTYQIGGRLVAASAGAGDAYLSAVGDAQIGRVFANGVASISAPTGSITGYLPGVAVSGETVVLNAAGDVGSSAAPFQIQPGAAGEVSGTIGGVAWLRTPTLAGQSSVALRIGDLSAAQIGSLGADGDLTILRALRATNGALALIGDSLTMATGAIVEAAGRVSISMAADIVIGRIVSAAASTSGQPAISVTTPGAIFSTADATIDLSATHASGLVSLAAGTGIGSTTRAISFEASGVAARTLHQTLYLATSLATIASSLAADDGAIHVSSTSDLTIAALTANGLASVTAQGAIDVATLTAGSATIAGQNAVTLGSLTTTGAASVTTPGAVRITTLTTGGTADVASTASTLRIDTGSAGATATLTAAQAITLGSFETTAGDLSVTSTAGGLTATTLTVAGDASVTAPGAVRITTLTTGGTADIASTATTLRIGTGSAGATATLTAAQAITLGSFETTAGDLSVTSTAGGMTATTLTVAGDASITTQGDATIGSLTAGRDASVTSQGVVDVATLTAGRDIAITSQGALDVGTATAGGAATLTGQNAVTVGSLTTISAASITTPGAVRITTLNAGSDATIATGSAVVADSVFAARNLTIEGQSIVFNAMDVGADARLTSAQSIDGDRIAATGDLIARAASGGANNGSIRIRVAGAAGADLRAADDVRLGRLGLGVRLVMRGTTLVAEVAHLPTGSSAPLDIDIGGTRDRAATTANLSIDAVRGLRAANLAVVDGLLTTSASNVDVASAWIPGALRMTTESIDLFANNRSPTPVAGYDIQLFQNSKPFWMTISGQRVESDALVIQFGTGVESVWHSPSGPLSGFNATTELAQVADAGMVRPGATFAAVVRDFVSVAARWTPSPTGGFVTSAPGVTGRPVNLGDDQAEQER